MRPYGFLLTSLATMACAPQVAHASPPAVPDENEAGPGQSVHVHSGDRSYARGNGWQTSSGDGSSTTDDVRDAKPNGTIDVHSFAGTVHVTGWSQNQLKVHSTSNGDCHVEIDPSGDRTSIRLQCTHGPGTGDLEIQVPMGSTVEARTLSAPILVSGLNGALRLQSVSSDIEVKGGTPSEIEARTTNGNVHIDAACSQIRAQSVSGDIHISGARGKASVHTVSGHSSLAGGDFGDVRFETVSGDIAFTGGIVGSFEVQDHSGQVVMHVPPTTNADVELRTFSGSLLVDVGNGPKNGTDHELDVKLGVGGARVRVRTFSGDVKLTR